MLSELHVRDLGVIADLTLALGPGMTAITGETGAGKTLVVEAIELLVGGRADPVMVRPGAAEARVEGRFLLPAAPIKSAAAEPPAGTELLVARAVPAAGRSRAYLDGGLATAAQLAEVGQGLVDLHGQHAHQSLLSATAQREALDRFGAVDLRPLVEARFRLADIEDTLSGLGGDTRAQAREVDLLRFQLQELEAAVVTDSDEDERLAVEEDLLADAAAHRDAGESAHEALTGEGGAVDRLGQARKACAGRRPFQEAEVRLGALQAELAEITADLRRISESILEEPELLDTVRRRRQLLSQLRRKYGERLSDVMEFETSTRARLADLDSRRERINDLEDQRAGAELELDSAATRVRRAREAAAPRLATAVEERLRELAMPHAVFRVEVDGDNVRFLIAANAGEPLLPLAKVASGGELSRVMLAARLVMSEAPPVLVFDEVDAGIGGQVAVSVGRALAALARHHQVLVVTHLPQVAAFADRQVAVAKTTRDGRTVADARMMDGEERVVELSRMLSGQPGSATARHHAEELLATAAAEREG